MSEAAYSVAPFRADIDKPADIARLHLESRRLQVVEDNNVFPNIYDSQADLTAIETFYVEPGGNFFVACTETEIAGFVGIQNKGCNIGELMRMAVMPECRRRGIGLELARTAVAWSRDNGFMKLKLSTGFKEHARPIYERVGFVTVGIKDNKDYMMELDLVSSSNDSEE